MHKVLVFLFLFFIYSQPSLSDESDDAYLLHHKEKIDDFVKAYLDDYLATAVFEEKTLDIDDVVTRGVWTTYTPSLGKEKKFVYLSACIVKSGCSFGDFLVIEIPGHKGTAPKILFHSVEKYGAHSIRVDHFLSGADLIFHSHTGGTGHQVELESILYLTYEDTIEMMRYARFDTLSFPLWANADHPWVAVLPKEKRNVWLRRKITTIPYHDWGSGHINFFSTISVEGFKDPELLEQFKKEFNYTKPLSNILTQKIVFGGMGGNAKIANIFYACNHNIKQQPSLSSTHTFFKVEDFFSQFGEFPFFTPIVNCIGKEPERLSWGSPIVFSVAKEMFADLRNDEFMQMIDDRPEEEKAILDAFKHDMLPEYREFLNAFSYDGEYGIDYHVLLDLGFVDLNNDGVNELIVRYDGRMQCGVSGRCSLYILEKNESGVWTEIGSFHDMGYGVYVMREQTNGYFDIKKNNKWNEVMTCKHKPFPYGGYTCSNN